MNPGRGLQRRTELPRGAGPERRTPLPRGNGPARRPPADQPPGRHPAPARGRRPTGPTAAVRRLVLERDGHRCVRCGTPCGPGRGGVGYSLQHRLPRGDGGTRDPLVNGAANLVVLCGHATHPDGCHWLAEHHRTWAVGCGYLIRHGRGTVPARHRVWWHGRWVLLADDGSVTDLADARRPPPPPGRVA